MSRKCQSLNERKGNDLRDGLNNEVNIIKTDSHLRNHFRV